MSSKTKIVVLHIKELIYTGIFILLGIILLFLLISMFTPEQATPDTKNKKPEIKQETQIPVPLDLNLF